MLFYAILMLIGAQLFAAGAKETIESCVLPSKDLEHCRSQFLRARNIYSKLYHKNKCVLEQDWAMRRVLADDAQRLPVRSAGPKGRRAMERHEELVQQHNDFYQEHENLIAKFDRVEKKFLHLCNTFAVEYAKSTGKTFLEVRDILCANIGFVPSVRRELADSDRQYFPKVLFSN